MPQKRAFSALIEWKDGLSNEARPVAADAGIQPGDIVVKPDAGAIWEKVAADSTDTEIATAEVVMGYREDVSGSVVTAARLATLKDGEVAFPADAGVLAKVKAAFERKLLVFRHSVVS